MYERDAAFELLQAHAKQGDRFAKMVMDRMDESISKWILRDSPPYRLKEMMRTKPILGGWFLSIGGPYYYPEEKIDLTPFKKKRSSMTGKVVKAASKSGSVFNPAIDYARPMQMFNNEWWMKMQISRKLMESHAFDDGDKKAVDWIDRERRQLSRTGFEYEYSFEYEDDGWVADGEWHTAGPDHFESYQQFAYGQLHRIKSDKSNYIQAADIAAGFARQAYERQGIAAVAGDFEYVTLNGERITQDNAERKFEVWRQLIDQERRGNQQKLVVVDY